MTYHKIEDFVVDWCHQLKRKVRPVRPWRTETVGYILSTREFVPERTFAAVGTARMAGTCFGDWVLEDEHSRTLAIAAPSHIAGEPVVLMDATINTKLLNRVRDAIIASGISVIDAPDIGLGLTREGFNALKWWWALSPSRRRWAKDYYVQRMAALLLGMHEVAPNAILDAGSNTSFNVQRAEKVFGQLGRLEDRLVEVIKRRAFNDALNAVDDDTYERAMAELKLFYSAPPPLLVPTDTTWAWERADASTDEVMHDLYTYTAEVVQHAAEGWKDIGDWLTESQRLLDAADELDELSQRLPAWDDHPWLAPLRQLHVLSRDIDSRTVRRVRSERTSSIERFLFEEAPAKVVAHRECALPQDALYAAYDLFLAAHLFNHALYGTRLAYSGKPMRYRASVMSLGQQQAAGLFWLLFGQDALAYLPARWRERREVPSALRLMTARRLNTLRELVERKSSWVRTLDLFGLDSVVDNPILRLPLPQQTAAQPTLMLMERHRFMGRNKWGVVPDAILQGWVEACSWLANHLGEREGMPR